MQYIDLVNRLRDRFNEVRLVAATTWTTAIGFDQFCKDAINYAYHDILNAEMQWPFLHQSATIKTTPGIQFYTPNLSTPAGFTSPAELKEIDWESFYISDNDTKTTITNEVHTIPLVTPFSVSPTSIATWQSDLGVKYANGVAFTPITYDPVTNGNYTILAGAYYFNSGDAGQSIKISYITQAAASASSVINAQHLSYMDYDMWRQAFLARDLDSIQTSQQIPQVVFKTNNLGEIGLSPVPDKIYYILFEYWLDALDLSVITDVPLLPSHFHQAIIDGASKYCYEFREDPQLAQMADARLKAGIERMRIEQINRDTTINAGFNWRGRGYDYTLLIPKPR